MTISKKLLVATCILTTSLTQAVSMKNFDRSTLAPYIIRAQADLYAHTAIAIRSGQKTHNLRKKAIKPIKKELKENKKSLKEALKTQTIVTADDKANARAARQLYKAFKNDVYKNWKKTQSLPAIQETHTV
jgi:hypothetical protein